MLDDMNGLVDWQGIDAAHHLHAFSDHKSLHQGKIRVISSAQGVFLTDSEGKQFLDGMAGLWCVAAGYGRDELVQAAAAQMAKLPYYNTFFKTTNEPAVQLAQTLARITPAGLNHVFYACSGSEAVVSALRTARVYWQPLGKP